MSRIPDQASEQHLIRHRIRLVRWLLLVAWLVRLVTYFWDSLPAFLAPAAFVSIGILLVVGLVLDAKARRIGKADRTH